MNDFAEPQGSKTLKRNEFENHIEWSKTCEL